jgi:hypothetical protein
MGHVAMLHAGPQQHAHAAADARTTQGALGGGGSAAGAMIGQDGPMGHSTLAVFVALLQNENTRDPYWVMRTDGKCIPVTEADVRQARRAEQVHEQAKRDILDATADVQRTDKLVRTLPPEPSCAAQAQKTAHAARALLADVEAAGLEAEQALAACTARCPTMGIIFEPGARVLRGQYLELWTLPKLQTWSNCKQGYK